ncbi:Delta-1-pyrroline-5-carboxylate dehydrogenase, mitochondrial [Holothuria leucospilota]|uniref:Delta-1-pyrroline-5-carboxylate dehydrogenase, mitochondrial n=1 Tax=Holothuria leucospilota TaxID=206669 RepID=A0A9Q1BBF4_HOLLE|nr:Delta-1-pyrroline-5-carboxylate dehydrogenase, mitochondrial [Holothuria leucospilota]
MNEEVLRLISEASPYAFDQDQCSLKTIIEQTHSALKDTAGNFYINDKSTGAVVNQQPFWWCQIIRWSLIKLELMY